MIRCAHVMAGASGGAETFFERLTTAQHLAGDDVLPVIRDVAGRAARLRRAGLDPVTMRFGGLADVFTGPRLGRALRRHRPSVVTAWMNRAARFTPKGDWMLVGRLGGYYDLGHYRRCDHLIGNTRGLVDWMMAQGWPAARVHHLPNFCPDPGQPVPDRMGASDDMRLIAACGRLHPAKAFDVLIAALRDVPGAALVIAGEGPDRAALAGLARRMGVADRVFLPGWVGTTAGLLAACDVFVCPSRHEPLGNVILEAWAACRPVIAAAAGPRELIAPNETGLIVPVDDADALATSLRLVLDHPALAADLAGAGHARWARDFAPDPALAAWRDFLGRVGRG